MKKACNTFKKYIYLFMFACLYFFNTSCGLDTYIVMKDPAVTANVPEYDNIQFQENYFEFTTKEYEYPGLKFLGTEIYYKIYNNYIDLETERSKLRDMASDEETAPNSATTLIDKGKCEYKKLKATGYNEEPLIPAAESVHDQHVYIRLTDYQSLEEFASKITIDGQNIGGSDVVTKPIRTDKNYTFNFGRKGNEDKEPLQDDEDVKKNSEYTKENTYYVCMFAVALGVDATYTPHYSNITYLGTVPIDASSLDN